MSMNNEELSIKFAVMENQLSNLVASNLRIEDALIKLGALDKAIAEMVASSTYLHQKVIEIDRDTSQCAAANTEKNIKVWEELNHLKEKISHAHGIALTAIWFVTAVTAVLGAFLGFLFNTAASNKDTNTVQTQQIQQLKEQANHYNEYRKP